jgi:hypothetical protein
MTNVISSAFHAKS